MLIALHMMKCYPTVDEGGAFFHVGKSEYNRRALYAIDVLNAVMPHFDFNKRFDNPLGKVTGVLDVTTCRIYKPSENQRDFWSGKDRHHALKYELIVTPLPPHRIIWANGAFKGNVHDLTIARQGVI